MGHITLPPYICVGGGHSYNYNRGVWGRIIEKVKKLLKGEYNDRAVETMVL